MIESSNCPDCPNVDCDCPSPASISATSSIASMQMFVPSGGDCAVDAPRGLILTDESGEIFTLGDTGDTREACEAQTILGNVVGWNFSNSETISFLQPRLSYDYEGVVATRDATIVTM